MSFERGPFFVCVISLSHHAHRDKIPQSPPQRHQSVHDSACLDHLLYLVPHRTENTLWWDSTLAYCALPRWSRSMMARLARYRKWPSFHAIHHHPRATTYPPSPTSPPPPFRLARIIVPRCQLPTILDSRRLTRPAQPAACAAEHAVWPSEADICYHRGN